LFVVLACWHVGFVGVLLLAFVVGFCCWRVGVVSQLALSMKPALFLVMFYVASITFDEQLAL
jgi:hypothetical protein